jgi:hypothetical protein
MLAPYLLHAGKILDFLSGMLDSDVKVVAWMNHLCKFYKVTVICETKLDNFMQMVSDSLTRHHRFIRLGNKHFRLLNRAVKDDVVQLRDVCDPKVTILCAGVKMVNVSAVLIMLPPESRIWLSLV